jgi:hypothetical protein
MEGGIANVAQRGLASRSALSSFTKQRRPSEVELASEARKTFREIGT